MNRRDRFKAWVAAHDWILWIAGIGLLVLLARWWDTLKNFVHDVTSLQSESVPGWLYGLGIAAILASLLVLCAEAYYKLKLLKNPPIDPDDPGKMLLPGDLPEFIKALGDAPKWIGLIVAGAGLIVLGLMADGYHWQNGGFSGPGTVIADAQTPTAETGGTTPTPEVPSDDDGNADFEEATTTPTS